MNDSISPIGIYSDVFASHLPYHIENPIIYQSPGLAKHILKRHPECLQYLHLLPEIISSSDYIGINPNEKQISFELVKANSPHIQIGIKLDLKNNYLYVATLHTITDSKLKHSLANGRLNKIDK